MSNGNSRRWNFLTDKLYHGEDWDSWLRMEFRPNDKGSNNHQYYLAVDVKVTRRCRWRKKAADIWQGGVAMGPTAPGDCLFAAFSSFLEDDVSANTLRQLCVRAFKEEHAGRTKEDCHERRNDPIQVLCTNVAQDVGRKAAILCRLAGCRAEVFDPCGLRYTVGESGPIVHLEFFAAHYVALKADAYVVKHFAKGAGYAAHPSKGAGETNRGRRRRSRSVRRSRSRRARTTLTPAPDRRASR